MLWRGGFQAGDRRLRCAGARGDFRLRKPRFGPRLEHLIEKSEFLGEIVVRLLHLRTREGARLEPL